MKEGKRQWFVTHVVTLTTPRGKKYTSRFRLSTGHFCSAAKNILTQQITKIFL